MNLTKRAEELAGSHSSCGHECKEDLIAGIKAALRDVRNEALEEAAKLAEEVGCESCAGEYGMWTKESEDSDYHKTPNKIRALKEEGK